MSTGPIFGPPGPDGLLPISGADVTFWDPPPPVSLDPKQAPLFYGEGLVIQDDPWNVVYLNGDPLPGICSLKAESELQIEQKKGAGHDGARLTLHGYLPGPIVITITIWTSDQWREYLAMIPMFWRPPTKNDSSVKDTAARLGMSEREANLYQAAVTIAHPSLQGTGISAVIVRGISIPEDGPAPQSKVVRLRCVQYLPPSAKSAPSKTKDAKNVPIDSRVDAPKAPHESGAGPRGANHSGG